MSGNTETQEEMQTRRQRESKELADLFEPSDDYAGTWFTGGQRQGYALPKTEPAAKPTAQVYVIMPVIFYVSQGVTLDTDEDTREKQRYNASLNAGKPAANQDYLAGKYIPGKKSSGRAAVRAPSPEYDNVTVN